MGNNEHEVMADKLRAERIKKVILEHSTYEELKSLRNETNVQYYQHCTF
jgi:hypothetical protein